MASVRFGAHSVQYLSAALVGNPEPTRFDNLQTPQIAPILG